MRIRSRKLLQDKYMDLCIRDLGDVVSIEQGIDFIQIEKKYINALIRRLLLFRVALRQVSK